jgi:cellulose synthase/poly-beta-1,6-N-acetylglucosamine synthase-like glycosyltransferase
MPIKSNLSFVSVLIPCRNEEKFIAKCLDSIINNDYPKENLEVLVIDGMSEDKTRQIVQEYEHKYPFIKMLDNPNKITPIAFNIGIQQAKGVIVFTIAAHATYEKDYISKCVSYMEKYEADSVGGIIITISGNNALVGKAIVIALSHRFGVGNSYFRIGSKEPKFVDTVPFGCYKKEVFEKIGLFNENLVRNQDIEFNLRLKKAGGKVLLAPDIVSYYYARSDLKSLFMQNFKNGLWVIYSNRFAKAPFSWRHLIPFVFVSSLVGSLFLSIFWNPFLYLFLMIILAYLTANVFFSLNISLKNGMKLFTFIVISFFVLHFSYGFGSIWGLMKLITPSKIRR